MAALIAANLLLSHNSSLATVQNGKKTFGGPILSSSASIMTAAAVSSSGNPELSSFQEQANYPEPATTGNYALLAAVQPITASQKSKGSTNYFIIPTTGWNWGILHYNNAIDIANSCGTPVYAAAAGLIVESAAKGWNDGYGQYIKIEHPNKTETLYAHLDENVAPAGKYVLQGELIGYMGNTGNTHGPTGCHLHFEVHGAKNPLAK